MTRRQDLHFIHRRRRWARRGPIADLYDDEKFQGRTGIRKVDCSGLSPVGPPPLTSIGKVLTTQQASSFKGHSGAHGDMGVTCTMHTSTVLRVGKVSMAAGDSASTSRLSSFRASVANVFPQEGFRRSAQTRTSVVGV